MNCPSPCKHRGFATITVMLFLPLLILLGFAMGFTGYLIQYKTRMRSTCLHDGIELQKNLIRNEENLFRLNSFALSLRLALRAAYVELAAAIASENPAWIAEIEVKIADIKSAQAKLDRTQKTLIKIAEIDLQLRTEKLTWNLSSESEQMQSIWNFYLTSFTWLQRTNTPELAVEPDSPDPGPVYELKKDYVQHQRVAYEWQHRVQTKTEAQAALSSENSIVMNCAVSAKKEKGLWNILIDADKF
jgi:hypothetical protein